MGGVQLIVEGRHVPGQHGAGLGLGRLQVLMQEVVDLLLRRGGREVALRDVAGQVVELGVEADRVAQGVLAGAGQLGIEELVLHVERLRIEVIRGLRQRRRARARGQHLLQIVDLLAHPLELVDRPDLPGDSSRIDISSFVCAAMSARCRRCWGPSSRRASASTCGRPPELHL